MTTTRLLLLVAVGVGVVSGCANQTVPPPRTPVLEDRSTAMARPDGTVRPGAGTTEPSGPSTGAGESDGLITVPVSTSPPTTSTQTVAVAVASLGFVRLFWAPSPDVTYAQLADALDPYATATITDPYRAYDQAARPAVADPGRTATEITTQVLGVAGDQATVFARTVFVGGPAGRQVVTRTLTLTLGADGAWRVHGFA